jgi:hypothetical protein
MHESVDRQVRKQQCAPNADQGAGQVAAEVAAHTLLDDDEHSPRRVGRAHFFSRSLHVTSPEQVQEVGAGATPAPASKRLLLIS